MAGLRKTLRFVKELFFGTLVGLWAAEGFRTGPGWGPFPHVGLGVVAGITFMVVIEAIGQRSEQRDATKHQRAREAEIVADERLRARVRDEYAAEHAAQPPSPMPALMDVEGRRN